MKTSPYYLLILNAILAIGLTVLSLQYVQPKNCYNFCDPSYVIPYPKGSCYFGDQKAGWPIPVIVDAGDVKNHVFLCKWRPIRPFTLQNWAIFFHPVQ